MIVTNNTKTFAPIRLEEMNQVRLMNRTDTKYWFHQDRLPVLFNEVYNNYFILTMRSRTALPYSTVYYDTSKSNMFIAHHNGKLNRFKVRRRSYVESGVSFLEVKFKNNKGRTIKQRIPSEFRYSDFTSTENEFIKEATPFSASDLLPTLMNNFNRITLVNKNFRERCTIDFNLEFSAQSQTISLNNLAIVEIKTEGSASLSPLAKAIRNQRIKTSGFSKYCIGRVVTDRTLKRNGFKNKIRAIEKIIEPETNLY